MSVDISSEAVERACNELDEEAKVEGYGRHLYADILRAQAERIKELEDHISDLLVDLPCACAHDNPGDVCLKHMPKFRVAQERIKELEAQVDEEISNRDGFERAFSAAYEAATGREMVWSSDFGIAEALQEIREASVGTRNDALREAAHECEQVAYSGKYPQDDQSELGCLRCRDNILARIEGDTND